MKCVYHGRGLVPLPLGLLHEQLRLLGDSQGYVLFTYAMHMYGRSKV